MVSKVHECRIEYWNNLPKINEKGLWIEAGLSSSVNKWLDNGVGLIDAFLITLTRRNNLHTWSLDKKLLKQLNEAEIHIPEQDRPKIRPQKKDGDISSELECNKNNEPKVGILTTKHTEDTESSWLLTPDS